MTLPWRILALSAVFLVAVSSAFMAGRSYERDKQAAERLVVLERERVQERQRQLQDQKIERLSRELEDQARAEPATSPVCLPASRVRRLNLQ